MVEKGKKEIGNGKAGIEEGKRGRERKERKRKEEYIKEKKKAYKPCGEGIPLLRIHSARENGVHSRIFVRVKIWERLRSLSL